MESILETIANNLEKDLTDYFCAYAPIILSFVAILITLWNSFWADNRKKLEANIVWDELFTKFYIIIRNTGRKTLVIDSISLYFFDEVKKEIVPLGERKNVWSQKKDQGFIKANEAFVFEPCYNSLYDVFAYRGHYFDVNDENMHYIIKMCVIDIDGKRWNSETAFTLGVIDELLEIASQ